MAYATIIYNMFDVWSSEFQMLPDTIKIFKILRKIKEENIGTITQFVEKVKDNTYPGEEHGYHILEGKKEKFLEMIK